MRKKTKELQETAWEWLRTNPDLNGFKNLQEFQAAWVDLDEVAGDGSESFFTRENVGEIFQPGNVAVVNVRSPRDFEKVLDPAVGGASYE